MVMVLYCDECQGTLDRLGHMTKEVHDLICHYYFELHRYVEFDDEIGHLLEPIMNEIHESLQCLEKEKFILSTESSQTSIMIKPLGHILVKENVYEFCVNRVCHD
jgi:hypothetical protein